MLYVSTTYHKDIFQGTFTISHAVLNMKEKQAKHCVEWVCQKINDISLTLYWYATIVSGTF